MGFSLGGVEIKELILTKGKTTSIDDADFIKASKFKWYWQSSKTLHGYAATGHKPLMLHNFILQPPEGLEVDHIDGNGLNNTRENLRLVTRAQQCQNRKQSSYKSSKFKGVRWWKYKNVWQARIKKDGKSTHLGYFNNEVLAAKTYDIAAKELFGEYAKLNF